MNRGYVSKETAILKIEHSPALFLISIKKEKPRTGKGAKLYL